MSDWRLRAACRGMGPDLFFSVDEAEQTAALAVCDACTVTAECQAASTGELGVWAGVVLTQFGRRRRCDKCGKMLAVRAVSKSVRCADCRSSGPGPWDRNRACLWQGCRRPFYAHYNYQLYCSAACRGRASEASRRVS